MQPVLRRRGDAGLVAPWNGTVASAAPAGWRRPRGRARTRRRRRRRSRRPRRSRAGRARERASLPRQRSRGHLRERLGQRVDRPGRAVAPVGLVSGPCRARSRRRPLGTAAARRRRRRSGARSRGTSAGSLPASAGRTASNAARAPVDVGLEVDQVDVRVALLLAGDLRLRDLAEQLDGAVGDLGGLELDRAHRRLQPADVVDRARRPAFARALAWCPAPRACARSGGSPSTATRGTSLARASMSRVEVAEALGHRLDPLVGHARGRVERAWPRRRRRGPAPANAPARGHERGGLRARGRRGSRRPLLQRRAPARSAARAPVTVSEPVARAGAGQRSV